MNEQESFQQKALSGYIVCFADQCPMHADCLRWKVGQQEVQFDEYVEDYE